MRARQLVRYMVARNHAAYEELAFRTYVTDALYYTGRNMTLGKRWAEIMEPRHEIDADAVIEGVISGAGLVVT